jgi:hypothetical protein
MAKSLGMTLDEMRDSHCTGCLDYNNPFDMRPFDPEYPQTPYAKYPPSKVSQLLKTSLVSQAI